MEAEGRVPGPLLSQPAPAGGGGAEADRSLGVPRGVREPLVAAAEVLALDDEEDDLEVFSKVRQRSPPVGPGRGGAERTAWPVPRWPALCPALRQRAGTLRGSRRAPPWVAIAVFAWSLPDLCRPAPRLARQTALPLPPTCLPGRGRSSSPPLPNERSPRLQGRSAARGSPGRSVESRIPPLWIRKGTFSASDELCKA